MASATRLGSSAAPAGRSARVRAAAIAATLAELAEGGYSALSLESVARRAGVHKTTLYRRWGTREELVLEAMLERAGEHIPVPDTGSLREDLLELARTAAANAASPEVAAMARAVAAESPRDSRLAAANRRFWAERLALDGVIVERAIERGEVGRRDRPAPRDRGGARPDPPAAAAHRRARRPPLPRGDRRRGRWWRGAQLASTVILNLPSFVCPASVTVVL